MRLRGAACRWGQGLLLALGLHVALVVAALLLNQTPKLPPHAQSMDAVFVELAPLPEAAPPASSDASEPSPDTRQREQEAVESFSAQGDLKSERVRDALEETPSSERTEMAEEGSEASASTDTGPFERPVAPKSELTGPGTTERKTVPMGEPVETWQARLLDHMKRHRRYPRQAERRGLEGVSFVRFVVDRHGRVISAEIEVSSENQSLDDEALATVYRASPMPPPPPGVSLFPLEVVLPVDFSLSP